MSRITVTRAKYKFEHYEQTPVKINAHSGGYDRKLFKDMHHKIPVKINVLDNVSDIIFGKCK